MLIENALIFGLGFCVAIVLALLFLPAVWSRAMRLTRQRLQRLVPLSEAEIGAAWDGLRAEAAVGQRRLEQGIEQRDREIAAHLVEIGRRTVELSTLEAAKRAVQGELTSLRADWEALKADAFATDTQRAALQLGFDQQTLQLETSEQQRSALAAQAAALDLQCERQRAAVAGLETQKQGFLVRLEDMAADLNRMRTLETSLRNAAAVLERERDSARNEVMIAAAQRSVLDQKLQVATDEAAQTSVRFHAKSEALARAERQIMDQKQELQDSTIALEALRKRFEDLRARLISEGSRSSSSEGDIEALRAAVSDTADEALSVLDREGPSKPLEFGRA